MKYYKISEKKLKDLLLQSTWLEYAEANGIDNWDDSGYMKDCLEEDYEYLGIQKPESDEDYNLDTVVEHQLKKLYMFNGEIKELGGKQ